MTPSFIVTGASSGLGWWLANRLRGTGPVVTIGGPNRWETLDDLECDLHADLAVPEAHSAEARCNNITQHIEAELPPRSAYNVLVNCAGVNYIERFEDTDFAEWDQLMALNARAPVMLTRALLPWLKAGASPGTVVNVVSNASHTPMTNSVCYNASKGAAHIATLAMARELGKRFGLTIFGVSPNKMSGTAMTDYIDARVPELRGWSYEEARNYQLAGLPTGEETPPEAVAEFMAFLLSSRERHRYLHATVLPYGG